MTNIEQVKQWFGDDSIRIPQHFRQLEPQETIKEGDRVCMVSISSLSERKFSVTWLKCDLSEIGKPSTAAGAIVIREFVP